MSSLLTFLPIFAAIFLTAAAFIVVIVGVRNRQRRGDLDIMRHENFRLQREASTLRLLLYFSDADRNRRLVLLRQTDPGKHHPENVS